MLASSNWALIREEAVRCNQKKRPIRVAFFDVQGRKYKVEGHLTFDLRPLTYDFGLSTGY